MADSFNITLHCRSSGLLPPSLGRKGGKLHKVRWPQTKTFQHTQKQVVVCSLVANNGIHSCMLIIRTIFYVLIEHGYYINVKSLLGWSDIRKKGLVLANLSLRGSFPVVLVQWMNYGDGCAPNVTSRGGICTFVWIQLWLELCDVTDEGFLTWNYSQTM